jgi:hypothetical protein
MEVFGIALAVAILLIGGVIYENATKPGSPIVSPNDPRLIDCRALCNQWDARRQERCNLEASERSAWQEVNRLTAQLAAATVVATALWVAYAAALASIFGIWAAPALLILAIAASAAVTFITGQLVVANLDAGNKAKGSQAGRDAEAAARKLLIENCKNASEIDACLLRAAPC